MKEIEIQNEEVLRILNDVLFFYNNRKDIESIKPQCYNHTDKKTHLMSDEYLQSVVDMGDGHNGFPETLLSYNLADSEYNINNDSRALPINWTKKWQDINTRLMTALSVRNNAVASLYPPGGFISWHNNANAAGFNIIFTWSETGDSWFDYIEDNGKGERIRCQDKAGQWVCRYGIFGPYHQDEHPIVYHAADTNCWRITLAYVFSIKEAAGGLQEFIIEELTTP